MTFVGVADIPGPPPYVSDANRPKPRRHEEYYFEDGNLVIQVMLDAEPPMRHDLTST